MNDCNNSKQNGLVSLGRGMIIGVILALIFIPMIGLLLEYLLTTFNISRDGISFGLLLVGLFVIIICRTSFVFILKLIVPPDSVVFECNRCGKTIEFENRKDSHTFSYWNWRKILKQKGWKIEFGKHFCQTCKRGDA